MSTQAQEANWIVPTTEGPVELAVASPDLVTQAMSAMDEHTERRLVQEWTVEVMSLAGPGVACFGLRRIAETRLQQETTPRSQQFYTGLLASIAVVEGAEFGENEVLGMKAGLGISGQVKGEH